MWRMYPYLSIVIRVHVEGIEGIKMKIAILILFFSARIFATHYSYRKSGGLQSFRPIGGFQQHVSQAHFGV